MKPIFLMDFGSTYTKLTAIDPDGASIIATAQSETTAATDIGIGLAKAEEALFAAAGKMEASARYACSSAAGGLRMIASGLVPALTAEAAKRAALGAGAKVIRTYSYQLTDEDIGEIQTLAPDMILLSGGTDGGNRENIEANAQMIARCAHKCPVIIAGNRAAAKDCQAILSDAGFVTIVTQNVMPTFGTLSIAPAQAAIRELFLERIIQAKGLAKAQSLISGILMPTPAAVLEALELLAKDVGELMAVDLGGATTDVFSITAGEPTKAGTVLRGLPEPYAKRTVEGDIGMRYSAHSVVESEGSIKLARLAGQSEEMLLNWIALIDKQKEILPQTDGQRACDFALATAAVSMGLSRHAGTIEQVYTPMGVAYQQTGKDLTRTKLLLLTGGALIHSGAAERIAASALADAQKPGSLVPEAPAVALDRSYILSAMGLLAQSHPELSRKIMVKEFA